MTEAPLYVTGHRSTIVTEFARLYPDIEARPLPAYLDTFGPQELDGDCERLLLCAGVLHQKQIKDQTREEISTSLAVNLISVIQLCETMLGRGGPARICVIGSESAYKGSFDTTYAVAKAGLHSYVETRALGPNQQLVAISPTIIWNSGMTQRRKDLKAAGVYQRAGRFLHAEEVSKLAHFLLYEDKGMTRNTVIRMRGGTLR